MKAKKTKSKRVNIFKPTVNRVYGIAIITLFLLVFVQGTMIWDLRSWAYVDATWKTRALIQQSLSSLNELGKEGVVNNTETGTTKIPEARIVLPYDIENHRGLGALYSKALPEGDQAQIEMITFSDNNARSLARLSNGSMEELFKGLPLVQACSRQAMLKITKTGAQPADEGYTTSFTKTLKDGRQVTGYTSTVCSQDADKLSKYVQQLQSY